MADSKAAGYTDNGKYIPAGIVLGEYSYSNTRAGKEGFLSNKKGDKPSEAYTPEYWNAVWKATANPMAIGNVDTDANGKGEEHNGHGVLTRQITGVAAGTDLTDAVNVAQLQAAIAQFSGGGSGTSGDGVHYYSVFSDEKGDDSNYDNKGAKGKNSLAAGVSASTTENAENAVAIGYKAKADGVGATVIGQYGTATGRYALAFGGQQTDTSAVAANNVASGDNSVAFGERTTASGSNSTAFGQGTQATEKRATAFGQRTQATQSNATAFGIDTIASGQNATAFGNLTQATEIGATAFGNKNKATGQYATAWGGGDKVVDNGDGTTTKVGTVASGTYATAFGERTEASGESATAFGSDSTASGKNAAAFGENSTASGEASTAFGIGSTAAAKNSLAALGGKVAESAENAVAIGKDAQAKLADTVALGSGSVADRQSGVKGYDAATGAETTQTSATWVSNANAIAVGNGSTLTRQITGVAAGSLDTDAVNVAQLKAVDAKHTIVTVGGQAVTADNTPVTGGNLDLKRTTATNGQETYDLKLNDNVTLGKDGADGREGTIGLTGKDGKQGYSTTIIKTEKGQPGADGKNGKPGVDGKDITRIVYTDKDGSNPQTVATLDDGLKFAGDVKDSNAQVNAFSRKLNEQTNVVGGVTNLDDLSKGNNVGVVSNGTDTLTIRLAKKLTDLTSVTTVTKDDKGNKTSETVQDGNGITITPSTLGTGKSSVSLTDNGLSNGGNQITHVDSGLKDAAGNKVELKDAAGDVLNNAVNVGDLQKVQNAVTSAHTAVTVNGSVEAPEAGADGKLGAYTDKGKGNLLLAQKKDSTTGKITYDLKLNDNITLGKDGADGREGTIGLTGKDGKQGYSTTIIKTEKGQPGADGKNGKPGVDGKDITRIVYTDKDGSNPQTVATMDDGLKFAGDDGAKTVAKKLNDTLQIRGDGTYDTAAHKTKEDGNIQVSADTDTGTIKVSLSDKINLHQDGYLTVGGSKNGEAADGSDPIVIKNFGAGELTVTGTDKDGKTPQSAAGDYVTGLDNKDWDVSNPTYVSGRAATEDQLKKVNDAVKDAAATAGKHTVVTVNDKDDHETKAAAGDGVFGEYAGTDTDNLLIAAKNNNGQMTYNIKLNDQLAIGQKGESGVAGKDGKDGKVTVETKGGTTVVIGHDGEPGKNGKDGISVKGQDGKDGVTISVTNGKDGKDGSEGHIGLTGPAGKDGKDASADIHVQNGQNGVDGTDGNNGKDGMDRVVYEDHNGKTHEVATMDDGLKFVGNDGQEVIRKLNSTLSIKGGLDRGAVAQASSKNLGVRQNATKDGLEIVMTDTPDFTKVTVGGDKKITIGGQTNSDTKNPAKGNYITGLDNTKWDAGNVVADRAATEGQLSQAITDISGKDKGGFGLADEKGGTVKKNLGETIAVKGDGKNIETTVKDGALEVSLKKDVDLGKDGSIKAGETTIDKDGVDTNKVKVGDITITKDGINGGAKQITNIASGIDGKQYTDAGDNNAASIGDVKKIAGDEAGKAAEAVKSKSGKNITVKDDHTVNLNDNITLGDETDASKQVSIDGNGAKVTAGDGANKVTVDGSKGQVTIGTGDKTMTLGKQANTAGDSNPAEGNYLNGLDNTKWDGEHIQSGRAATEDQLKTVSDKVNSGRKFQGDDGQNVTVGMGDTLKIQGGVKAEDVSQENNIGIVKGADDTLNIRLAKDLKGINSIEAKTITTGDTTINNSGLTVKGDDNHKAITIQQGNVNMGGNTISGVADGKVSKDSTDAVNGSQLWQRDQAINGLSGSVNKLGNRINRVGAGAAALAALHPLDFDPDDKWDFAAGYGNYRGANAAAIGAYYRPNEDTMFSVGGSFGGGENMVNAGVSIKLGQGNHVSTSRVAMAKEMKAMRQHMAEQDALIAKLQSMHGMAVDPAKSTLFPDVAENHWAYQYVTTLAKKGILEGYPDGEFKGDRMMTRYEFAAIVYRIVESGVGSTDPELSKLVKEFSPELQYIRIDTIQKDRNGKPTIERVRVISDAK